jgi:hypothetical protein
MKIKEVTITQRDEVFQLIMDCRKAMEEEGVFQWTDQYPTLKIISNDIQKGNLYRLTKNGKIAGVININELQDPEYKQVKWKIVM